VEISNCRKIQDEQATRINELEAQLRVANDTIRQLRETPSVAESGRGT
jgi:TolA-binding protein